MALILLIDCCLEIQFLANIFDSVEPEIQTYDIYEFFMSSVDFVVNFFHCMITAFVVIQYFIYDCENLFLVYLLLFFRYDATAQDTPLIYKEN